MWEQKYHNKPCVFQGWLKWRAMALRPAFTTWRQLCLLCSSRISLMCKYHMFKAKFIPNTIYRWEQVFPLQMTRLNCCVIIYSLQPHWQNKRGTECVKSYNNNKSHWKAALTVSRMWSCLLFIDIRATVFHSEVTESFYFWDWLDRNPNKL